MHRNFDNRSLTWYTPSLSPDTVERMASELQLLNNGNAELGGGDSSSSLIIWLLSFDPWVRPGPNADRRTLLPASSTISMPAFRAMGGGLHKSLRVLLTIFLGVPVQQIRNVGIGQRLSIRRIVNPHRDVIKALEHRALRFRHIAPLEHP
ncbi:hypothetical protein KY49_2819 [Burkholderia sp. MSHR3999]|nr:hypothetical protein KY49_2819 [Burkholderia sp. MSHR3999]